MWQWIWELLKKKTATGNDNCEQTQETVILK